MRRFIAHPPERPERMVDGRYPAFRRQLEKRTSAIGRTWMALIVVLGFVAAVQACNVPVFRFALERWRPDPYRMTVFHRESLTDADRALIGMLEERHEKSSLSDPKRPSLVVHYPTHLRIAAPIWSGPLNTESVAHLTDSPIRKTLVGRRAVEHSRGCGVDRPED